MPDKLNVLHVLRAPIGGLFRHVCDLAEGQSARGHSIGVVCDGSALDEITRARLTRLAKHCRLGISTIDMSREISHRDASGYRRITHLARECRADIIHGHGAKGGAFARLAARSSWRGGGRALAFYTPHGGSLHYDRATLKGRLFLTIEKALDRLTSGLIFESEYAARVYRRKVGEPAAPSRVIYNGLARADFDPHHAAPGSADFLFVGELRRLKGVDVLIAALARVTRERAARLLVVGAGPDAEAFKALSRSLGLGGAVQFLEAMPARDAFARARSLVLPSRAESLPYIVLEAAAAGLPVIATHVGGLPEIVAGTAISLVAPGDADALAQAMLDFLADPGIARHAAADLKRRVADRFGVERMTDAVLEFYRTAIAADAASRQRNAD